jgi:hypothetical protein
MEGVVKFRIVQTALAILAVTRGGAVAPVAAQEARVVVSGAPNGASFMGCFRAEQNLFGRNRLTFCLDRRGTYRITGAVHCDGDLNWRVAGRTITVDLRRARCSRGVTWERASMTCNSTGRLLPAMGGRLPRVSALRCTYRPTLRGQQVTTFTARRS